ncbi:MAG: hypothetical protein WBZ14_09695 [Terriglobales bacterium]|jgi:hypothetical protein
MHPQDIALRRDAQGKIEPYTLEVLADDLDPDDCPVEVVQLDEDLAWRLRHLHRGGFARVYNVFPCSYCGAPICVLRLENERVLRICDAEHAPLDPRLWRNGKPPDDYPRPWYANVFVMHECACAEFEQ